MIPLCNAYVALSGANYACVGSNSDRRPCVLSTQHRFCVLYMVNSLGTRRPDHASRRIYGLVCLACGLARPSSSHTVHASTVITSLLYVIDVTMED